MYENLYSLKSFNNSVTHPDYSISINYLLCEPPGNISETRSTKTIVFLWAGSGETFTIPKNATKSSFTYFYRKSSASIN